MGHPLIKTLKTENGRDKGTITNPHLAHGAAWTSCSSSSHHDHHLLKSGASITAAAGKMMLMIMRKKADLDGGRCRVNSGSGSRQQQLTRARWTLHSNLGSANGFFSLQQAARRKCRHELMLTCLQIEIAASIRSDVWLPYPALCSTTPPHAAVCCCLQVQQLAVDLGLDRSEVLTWIAAFRAAPREEQRRQLAPLQGELAAARAAAAAAAPTADAVRAAWLLYTPDAADQNSGVGVRCCWTRV